MRGQSAGCALEKLPWEIVPGAPQKLPSAALGWRVSGTL